MTSTALGANDEITRTITFKNAAHKKFYLDYLPKCRYKDVYHKALIYCLGMDEETRNHVDSIYDFKSGCVKTESGSHFKYGFSAGLIVQQEVHGQVQQKNEI